jgi:hypothetical protein
LLLGLFAIFNAPIPAFADSATMAMLGDEKEMYGRVRLGGTIGFGIAAILTGIIIQSNGIQWAFWGYAAFMFLALCVSQKFTYSKSREWTIPMGSSVGTGQPKMDLFPDPGFCRRNGCHYDEQLLVLLYAGIRSQQDDNGHRPDHLHPD